MAINIKLKKEDKILFCSDLHFGHNKEFLFSKRGFSSIEEHDQFLWKSFEDHITPETILFNLGDVCLTSNQEKNFERLSQIPCKAHYLLRGNHEAGAKQAYQKILDEFKNTCDIHDANIINSIQGIYPLSYNNITFCGDNITLTVGKKLIYLSHFPYRIWDHMAKGTISISGHSHSGDPERNVDNSNGRALDVGVESAIKYNGTPFFSLEEINKVMEKKEIYRVDNHH